MKYDIKKVKMIISDVDGVWTDGAIYKGKDGIELKRFCVMDGAGVVLLREAKMELALISGRYSDATAERAKELKIENVYNGTLNKIPPYLTLKEKYNLKDEEIAYIGDDMIDIPIMAIANFPSIANLIDVKPIQTPIKVIAFGKIILAFLSETILKFFFGCSIKLFFS